MTVFEELVVYLVGTCDAAWQALVFEGDFVYLGGGGVGWWGERRHVRGEEVKRGADDEANENDVPRVTRPETGRHVSKERKGCLTASGLVRRCRLR